MQNPKLKSILKRLLNPPAIFFGIALIYFAVSLVQFVRFIRQAREPAGFSAHWHPLDWMFEPSLLLFASLCLLLPRIWSYIVAILLSGNVVYIISHLGLLLGQTDFDGSGSDAWRLWLLIMLERQPREIFEIVFGSVILLYAVGYIVVRLRRASFK